MSLENIEIVAGGRLFEGWTKTEVTAAWHKAVREFTIEVTEIGPFGESPFSIWHFPPGTPIQVYASGAVPSSLLIDGVVIEYRPAADSERHAVTIAGQGLGRNYVDCGCQHPTGRFEQQTILAIAQALAAPYGIIIQATVKAAQVAAEVISPAFQIRRGSTPWAELMRLLPQRGATLMGEANGSISIAREGVGRHAGGLIQGQNIKAMSAILSDAQLFGKYDVVGQASVGAEAENFEVFGTAEDPTGAHDRMTEVIDTAETTNERAQSHAEWLKIRASALSKQATLVVPGFRDEAGEIWTPNRNVFVMAPWLKLEQDMTIMEVIFEQSNDGGTTSTITVTRPEDQGGDPAEHNGSGPPWTGPF